MLPGVLELLELLSELELELPELALPGELELPWLELAPVSLTDRTAKSIFPEPALMMQSLIVPIDWPDDPVTCAPVN